MWISGAELILAAREGQTPLDGPGEQATQDITPAPRYAGLETLAQRDRGLLALVGDTQRASRWELWWRHHDPEQRALFADLEAREPDAVVNLGDLVTWGTARRAWRHFDRVHRGLRAAGVPILPVRGNHDYLPTRAGLRRHWARRFPAHAERGWYRFTWRGLVFVVLDSNLRALGARARAAQDRWLQQTLQRVSADAEIRGVIGLWHHPPYTNSRVVRPSAAVERRFVAPLLATGKARAVFCGHCHAYERFEQGGVPFIVTGGGGGPLQPVEHRPKRQRFVDRFHWPWPVRFLNYCLIRDEPSTTRVEVWRVVDPALPLERVDSVVLTRVEG